MRLSKKIPLRAIKTPQRITRQLLACLLLCLSVAPGYAAEPVAEPPHAPSTFEKIERGLRDIGQRAGDMASELSSTALGLVGVNYKFGGNHPDQGLDCSGFVRYVFQQATGIALPRSAREQAKVGQKIDKKELEPGDLVFFNTRRFQFSHVGMYIGDNRFIHSPSRGGSVEVVNFDNSYWQKKFNGARRIIGAVVAKDVSKAPVTEPLPQTREEGDRAAAEAAAVSNTANDRANAPFVRDY